MLAENETCRTSIRRYDMHCHIDFQEGPAAFLDAADALGLSFLSCTVTPEGYQKAQSWKDSANVALGLGAHPWWVADGRVDKRAFQELLSLVPAAPLIGEIGIDLSPKHVDLSSKERQEDAFRTIAKASTAAGGKVLSIHSVKSTGLVLDILEETGCTPGASDALPILHWFSGSTPELWHAIHLGCYFSVGEPFLHTRHAKEYLKLIPHDRLLLETDYPPEHAGFVPEDYERALSASTELIAQSWNVSAEEAAEALAATSEAIFRRARGDA